MKKRNKVTFSIIVFSFIVSLLVNFALLFSPLPTQEQRILQKRKKTPKIKVKLIAPKKEKKKEQNEQKKQIVNTEEKKEKKRPKKSKFLGKTNQTFKKETKAAKVGFFKKGSKGSKKAQSKKRRTSLAKEPKKKRIISLTDLAIKKPAFLDKKSNLNKGEKKGLERKVGVSQSNDFLEEIPLGDMTNLNTTEYRFYGFFQRIRSKLEQHWGRSLREKAKALFKSGKSLGQKEHKITALTVTINREGQIIEVVLKSKSGVKELDDAAIESFNKAGPFPNPPKGFIKNGRAKIEWGFVVKS